MAEKQPSTGGGIGPGKPPALPFLKWSSVTSVEADGRGELTGTYCQVHHWASNSAHCRNIHVRPAGWRRLRRTQTATPMVKWLEQLGAVASWAFPVTAVGFFFFAPLSWMTIPMTAALASGGIVVGLRTVSRSSGRRAVTVQGAIGVWMGVLVLVGLAALYLILLYPGL